MSQKEGVIIYQPTADQTPSDQNPEDLINVILCNRAVGEIVGFDMSEE